MKIAIWGMGISGVSALRAALRNSHLDINVINSNKPSEWVNIEVITELLPFEKCLAEDECLLELEFNQIILSPGIDRKSPLVAEFIRRGTEVISEIEFAARQVSLPIVAITGTNGKTTTTTMISECLKMSGKSVFVGGNIGIPFCDILAYGGDYDVAVLELSSFQLESLKSFKADVAILLNISESHMERYDSFVDYQAAKLNVFMNQGTSDLAIAPIQYLPLSGVELNQISGINLEETKLIGDHHLYNLFCVEKVLNFFKVEDPLRVIKQFLKEFTGVSYRLQFVGEVNGQKFFNDAKSTNPSATLSACNSFKEKEYTLIVGGKLRDQNTDLVKALSEITPKRVLAFGESKDLICSQLGNKLEVKKFENLKLIFKFLQQDKAGDNGDILFSPGFPSFDQYANYLERGEDFDQLFKSSFP